MPPLSPFPFSSLLAMSFASRKQKKPNRSESSSRVESESKFESEEGVVPKTRKLPLGGGSAADWLLGDDRWLVPLCG